MKIILVDAVNCIMNKETGIYKEMVTLLETYPNKKIVLTNANKEEQEKFNLATVPYPLFTLAHNPEKTNPEYYEILLTHFNLQAQDVIYFEHNKDAVTSAQSKGITTYHYDKDNKDLPALKTFLDEHL